jgi:hypothetical protein
MTKTANTSKAVGLKFVTGLSIWTTAPSAACSAFLPLQQFGDDRIDAPAICLRRANHRRPNVLVGPGCQAHLAKIFCFSECSDYPILTSIPSHQKGRIMIVANAGRDAVDADGVSDAGAWGGRAKSCGSGTPTLVSSLREGAQATVANKPGAPGRSRSSR